MLVKQHRKYTKFNLVLLAACIFVTTVASTSQGRTHLHGRNSPAQKIIHPYSMEGFEKYLYLFSPDRKYVARIVGIEGDLAWLDILKHSNPRRHPAWKYPLASFNPVYGTVWLPHHRHTLIIAASGIYSAPGLLGLWNGHFIPLLPLKKTLHDWIYLSGVTADGTTILYHRADLRLSEHGHGAEYGQQLNKIHRLKLSYYRH